MASDDGGRMAIHRGNPGERRTTDSISSSSLRHDQTICVWNLSGSNSCLHRKCCLAGQESEGRSRESKEKEKVECEKVEADVEGTDEYKEPGLR